MSGIVVSYGEDGEAYLKKMLKKMKHRGERYGLKAFNNMALGYRDNLTEEEAAADDDKDGMGQPRAFTSIKGASVVLDGYLFNDEVIGHEDGRYIASLFKKEGKDFIAELDGSFAFAVTDGKDLLVARDPYGVKPLYYGREDGNIYFASELKELIGITKNIKVFPPGHYYYNKEGLSTYVNEEDNEKTKKVGSLDKALSNLKKYMLDAVDKRIWEADTTGILLSGGLDSSIVAAAASQLHEQVKTFAVGLEGCPDLEAARKVAHYLGADHHEYTYTPQEILEVLPEVIYHLESYDAPLVQSAIANFFASKIAAEAGCRSVLCGEGADELFAGYHYVKDMEDEEVQDELDKIASIGHGMGFQRVDRMNSAHALESHMPFMDQEIVDFAQNIPLEWKIYGEEQVEKWILRKAFEGELPAEVVWRRKAQFSHGTGCNEIMQQVAENQISDEEYKEAKKKYKDDVVRSKEEYLYFKIFKEFYPQESALKAVTHWSDF